MVPGSSRYFDAHLRPDLIIVAPTRYELIEFRIIYLQRKQSRLLPESHYQGGSAAHPLERATSMQAQLRKGARAEVGEFVLLPVRPQILHRMEFGSIGRKEFQPQASALLANKVPHQVAAMTAQA